MSNSLVKLIELSIFPIALLICAKVVGLILVNTLFNLDWHFVTSEISLYSIRIAYVTQQEKLDAASYSNLLMYLVVFVGFCMTLVQAYFLHESHVSPKTYRKLMDMKLTNFVKDSFEVFHHAFVWLILIWISTLIIIVSALSGDTYLWIAALTSLLTIILTVLLAKDYEDELKLRNQLKEVAGI